MPQINPISRKELISKLKKLGFDGPFRATKHHYMIKGKHKIFIPNPHGGKDIGIPLLKKIVRQIGIKQDEFIELWDSHTFNFQFLNISYYESTYLAQSTLATHST